MSATYHSKFYIKWNHSFREKIELRAKNDLQKSSNGVKGYWNLIKNSQLYT